MRAILHAEISERKTASGIVSVLRREAEVLGDYWKNDGLRVKISQK